MSLVSKRALGRASGEEARPRARERRVNNRAATRPLPWAGRREARSCETGNRVRAGGCARASRETTVRARAHALPAEESSIAHQVDDDDASIALFALPRIARRCGWRNRQLQVGLRRVAPLSLFPLPDLLNDERRQHRLLPSAPFGAYSSCQCSQSSMLAIQMPQSPSVLFARMRVSSFSILRAPRTNRLRGARLSRKLVMPTPCVKGSGFHRWDTTLSPLHGRTGGLACLIRFCETTHGTEGHAL